MIQKDIKTTYIKATTMRKYELQTQLVLLIKADQHSALEMLFFLLKVEVNEHVVQKKALLNIAINGTNLWVP